MQLLLFALVNLAVQGQSSTARFVLQAPAASMNPPVLESGPARPLVAPAASDAVAAPPAAVNGASSSRTFPTMEAALTAANLTTLAAAVQVAGLPPSATENATILAPTNKAFEKRLLEDLQITPQQLLNNKTLVVEVLSYHVIPGALRSSQLSEKQQLQTALAGAAPLVVKFDRTTKNGSRRGVPQIEVQGATNKAEVRAPDLVVSSTSTVVHVVNDVLLPHGVGTAAAKKGTAGSQKKEKGT